jgi:hypothetical protein
MVEDICAKLRGLVREKLRDAFDRDLEELLRSRQRELWVLGVDSAHRRLVDVCGTIGTERMIAINSKGFWDCDAGFRADAHKDIPTGGQKVDVFLLNTAHFEKSDSFLAPLVVHELAHYLEHIGDAPNPSEADKANAGALMACLRTNIRKIHTTTWAEHLAVGARRMVVKGKSAKKRYASSWMLRCRLMIATGAFLLRSDLSPSFGRDLAGCTPAADSNLLRGSARSARD